jgi:hypothetical protein
MSDTSKIVNVAIVQIKITCIYNLAASSIHQISIHATWVKLLQFICKIRIWYGYPLRFCRHQLQTKNKKQEDIFFHGSYFLPKVKQFR